MTKSGQAQDEAMDAILASIRSMMSEGESVVTPVASAAPVEPQPPPPDNVSKLFSEPPMPAVARSDVAPMPRVRSLEESRAVAVDAAKQQDSAVESAMVRAMEQARAEIESGEAAVEEESLMRDEEPPRPAVVAEMARDDRAIPPSRVEKARTPHDRSRDGASAQPLGPLLSREADAAVSGAFRDLATSVLSGSGRTIDDLVEDLLRPMLRDWLDDNLPTLVERLVREEIERVARGRR